LTVNPGVYVIGSDRSPNLIRIAHDRKINDSFVADALDLPHPDGKFDFAISIAVIHHFSSPSRRISAIRSILATLKQTAAQSPAEGKALIYVWALEQKGSRRGWDEGDSQDVFVPWVLPKQYSKSDAKEPTVIQNEISGEEVGATSGMPKQTTYQRYYHLYRRGELEGDIDVAGGYVLESGYEKDNWWAICSRKCVHK